MKTKAITLIMVLAIMLSTGCAAPAPAQEAPSMPAPAAQEPAPAPAAPPPAPEDGAPAQYDEDYPIDPGGSYSGASNYFGRESYLPIDENDEKSTQASQTVTFSLKVDTASYSNVERYLNNGALPPADAVRAEEMINYFSYDQSMKFGYDPFSIYTEVAPSPFNEDKYMAFIRVKAMDIDRKELPPSNLVFLIDTSGSMNSYDKLPLLIDSFSMLVDTLGERDIVSIVTYAGSSQVLLDGVRGSDKKAVLRAINSLRAGGSTAGADGILTAYELAERNYIHGGNNRIILASDGDFNVGISSLDGLNRLVSDKRAGGVYLSVLGFGTGNLRDDIMETLSKNGNGNYSYIDSVVTANKVLVDEMTVNLYTIANDVKAQVEFNPENVASYRLIGYENSKLKNRDFENDAKDAGEIGVGADVVMLFEIELQEEYSAKKYAAADKSTKYGDELFEVRVRYKWPGTSASRLMERPVTYDDVLSFGSSDYNFACAVAEFAQVLRHSHYASDVRVSDIMELASGSTGRDEEGYRAGFLSMLRKYRAIAGD